MRTLTLRYSINNFFNHMTKKLQYIAVRMDFSQSSFLATWYYATGIILCPLLAFLSFFLKRPIEYGVMDYKKATKKK